MGPVCAVWLLVARLGAEEPATPPVTPAAVEPSTAPTRDAAAPPAPPPPTRLALRDPFERPSAGGQYRRPVSPDLLDPFTRPPRATPQVQHSRDLRDPFVDGAVRRCIPQLHGVPLQRPRQLDAVPCATIDKPLRNPFLPLTTTAPTG